MKANKLNHVEHLTYINSVLASISIYYMSIVLLSNTFVEKINSTFDPFGGRVSKVMTQALP